MKKDQERALNAFAAMDTLPESMVLEAENALIAAEGGRLAPKRMKSAGLLPPEKKRGGRLGDRSRSGWYAAALSGIVAIAVLLLVLRAGREPTVYPPPKQPAGSSITMSDHGADFTLSMEQESYPDGTGCFTVIMTARASGERISWWGGWYLERVTEEGALPETVTYTEEGLVSAKPARGEYATLTKTLYGTYTGGGFPAGTYRLHATEYDGEKYVSVAYCTFTIGDPDGNTEGNTETPPAASFELAFPGFRISLPEGAYLYDKPNGLVISRDTEDPGPPEHITDESLPATRTLTVDGQELTLTYQYTESRNDPSDTDHYIYTQPGHAEGEWSILAIYPHGSDQLSRIHYRNRDGFLLDGLPATQAAAQAVADARVKELMGSLPRSSAYGYDADSKTHTVTYHNTSPLINTVTVSIYPLSNSDTVQILVSFPRHNEEKILADIGDLDTALLTVSLENFLSRYYADSAVTFEGLKEGVYATAGPRFHYTMTVTAAGRRQDMSIYVYQGGLQTDDPEKIVIRGTFFWADRSPYINLPWGGEPSVYPVFFTVENDSIDFSEMTSGDTVEMIIRNQVEETFPCHGWLYELCKLSDGSIEDLPDALIEAMERQGYTVTETRE